MASFASSLGLRLMGFCGVDDSISAEHLQMISIHYPWVEWGILFRPDKEGTARYATSAWVDKLSKINKDTGGLMRLAGHLCGSRCQDVIEGFITHSHILLAFTYSYFLLTGDYTFIRSLHEKGFGRVQINATKANNVKVEDGKSDYYVQNIINCMNNVPEIEWIIQCNDETKHIWEKLVLNAPKNMSILYDASCGLGKLVTEFPTPHPTIPCGYAGGIGPTTIEAVLTNVQAASKGKSVWIDMESSLRLLVTEVPKKDQQVDVATLNDVFSIEKAVACILIGVSKFGLPVGRITLLSI